jgi:hypothetical protein
MSPIVVHHQSQIGPRVWEMCALWYIYELCITLTITTLPETLRFTQRVFCAWVFVLLAI